MTKRNSTKKQPIQPQTQGLLDALCEACYENHHNGAAHFFEFLRYCSKGNPIAFFHWFREMRREARQAELADEVAACVQQYMQGQAELKAT